MQDGKPILDSDVAIAREALRPKVDSLKGAFQLWTVFLSADHMASAFVREGEEFSWEAKLAFTKAIVIEYGKPWSGRNGKCLKTLFQASDEFAFLGEAIGANKVHEGLIELRQRMVAHAGEQFESLGVTFRGIHVANNPERSSQQEGTIDEVFIPVAPKLEAIRSVWWIDDELMWSKISDHITLCLKLANSELARQARNLRDECFHHMHVMSELSDLIGLREIEESEGIDGQPTFDFQQGAEYSPTIAVGAPTPTALGDHAIQSLVTIFEPAPSLPSGIEIKGRGYRLTLPEPQPNGQAQWNIQFPKYPFPAEQLSAAEPNVKDESNQS